MDYARAAGRSNVATPQMVINGGRQPVVGNNRQQLEVAIAAARHAGSPAITTKEGTVDIGAGRSATSATVWAVRYDPRTNEVPIRAGENGGRTLPHRNIVRQLDAIGTWSGRPAVFRLPPAADPAFRTAILVQKGKGGPIEAAARL